MFKNYLKDIEGIASYPVLLLLVFFLVFIGIIYWCVKADKNQIQRLSELPLEHEVNSNFETSI